MLPEFDDFGNLPVGVYPATVEEISQRFNCSSFRARSPLTNSLTRYVRDIRNMGPTGLYIDGSYVSLKLAPSDVDIGVVFPGDFDIANNEWRFKNPSYKRMKLDIQLFKPGWNDAVIENILSGWQVDRERQQPKGIIYLELAR